VKWYIASTVFVLLGWYSAALRADEIPEYGPAHGTLIIVGGGSLKQTANLETFLRLAGGKNARLVVVPTAGGNKNRDGTVRKYDKDRVVAPWKALGITDVRMLHTHEPAAVRPGRGGRGRRRRQRPNETSCGHSCGGRFGSKAHSSCWWHSESASRAQSPGMRWSRSYRNRPSSGASLRPM
jgi:hypothetical protein